MFHIPVRIRPFFWLVAFLIGWLNAQDIFGALVWVGIILVSLLFHEFGHALMAMAFGQRARIELLPFGGVTYRSGKKIKLWQDFIIVFCGPLAGGFLALLAWIVLLNIPAVYSQWRFFLEITVTVNILWSLLNLLPVLPLDGGRLLSIVLEALWGFKGFKAALVVSVILGFVLSLGAFLIGQIFIGLLFFLLAFDSYRSTSSLGVMRDQDRDESLQVLYQGGLAKMREGKWEEAFILLQRVRQLAKEGVLYVGASEAIAEIMAKRSPHYQDDLVRAYELLLSLPSRSDEAEVLLHRLAYQIEQYDQVVKLANSVYQVSPTYEIAWINASAYAALGLVTPAMGWLECALREGMPQMASMLDHSVFNKIRQEKSFQQFVQSLRI